MKEQIEEMAKDLCQAEFWDVDEDCCDLELDRRKTAENLYNAGYIKIVPCKDCEHFYKVGSVGICRHWNFHSTKDDAYCSFAKMKGCAE